MMLEIGIELYIGQNWCCLLYLVCVFSGIRLVICVQQSDSVVQMNGVLLLLMEVKLEINSVLVICFSFCLEVFFRFLMIVSVGLFIFGFSLVISECNSLCQCLLCGRMWIFSGGLFCLLVVLMWVVRFICSGWLYSIIFWVWVISVVKCR